MGKETGECCKAQGDEMENEASENLIWGELAKVLIACLYLGRENIVTWVAKGN
jgi:hypothetical protein